MATNTAQCSHALQQEVVVVVALVVRENVFGFFVGKKVLSWNAAHTKGNGNGRLFMNEES